MEVEYLHVILVICVYICICSFLVDLVASPCRLMKRSVSSSSSSSSCSFYDSTSAFRAVPVCLRQYACVYDSSRVFTAAGSHNIEQHGGRGAESRCCGGFKGKPGGFRRGGRQRDTGSRCRCRWPGPARVSDRAGHGGVREDHLRSGELASVANGS